MYKILVADDEAIIREGIKSLFDWESLGYSLCAEASNGDSAYTEILDQHPDVVLLDIRMPGMTGLEVIKRAMEDGFSGKIIILSGFSDFKYAQEAIRLGVYSYLTKPIDEDELEETLITIKKELDEERSRKKATDHYHAKLKDSVICDLLLGNEEVTENALNSFQLVAPIYQVVIYEKYSHRFTDVSYNFADLLMVTNQGNNSFEHVIMDFHEVILLKGEFAIRKFTDFLARYEMENKPQKDSPLDSLFIAYGESVTSPESIQYSYQEASGLLARRFFCDQAQHTIGYEALPSFEKNEPIICEELLREYAGKLLDYIRTFNRNMVAETLRELNSRLYAASDSIEDIKLFLTDLYLRIKEQMNHLYSSSAIQFPSNAEAISTISDAYYLYEIILFFTKQFEVIMSAIGNSTRDSVLDDVLNYMEHNYTGNLTLENIAPLFGYNSSYLGKIFTKKTGESFNSYLDHIRIEHAKKLLTDENIKVYSVAEQVGYHTVDYFHVKFKKYVGMSPAEYRKNH